MQARNIGSARSFVAAYEVALGTQRWEVIAPLVHPDCTVTFSEGTYRGIAQVEAAFRKTFALIQDETYEMREVHWVLECETTAVLTFNFHWSGVIHGKAASGSGRGTSVLMKGSAGWQLICEHLGPEAVGG
jgi:hypothetical protein